MKLLNGARSSANGLAGCSSQLASGLPHDMSWMIRSLSDQSGRVPDDEKGLRRRHKLRAEGLPGLDVKETAQQVGGRRLLLSA